MTAALERRIRRILVALDASPDSLAALEAAAELAASLEVELAGLFVEEEELMRLSGSPLSREIDFISARARRLERGELERQLRAVAARARRTLARIAEGRGIRWSFRTARGQVARELLNQMAEADLVSLGAIGRSPGRAPGSTVLRLLAEASGPVLVLRRGARLGREVYVLHDGSDAAWRGLELAADLQRGRRTPAATILLSGETDARTRLQSQVEDWLGARDTSARYLQLTPAQAEAGRLPELLRREGCGLIVVPRSMLGGAREQVATLLRNVHCPVLLVE